MGQILIVDGSVLDRKRMRAILDAAGHDVIETADPEQALERLNSMPENSVNLVLTEVAFPKPSGLDLVRKLKAHSAVGHSPVLVVTEQQPRERLIQLIREGASTVIAKPFGGDLLLRRVTEALAERRTLRQGEGEYLTWQIEDYLRRELKRAERSGTTFSVVVCRLLDLMDGRALPHLLGGLTHLMRESDILARQGEDTVIALLPDTDWAGASTVEARILSLAEQAASERIMLPLRLVTGAATFPTEATDGQALLSLAQSRAG